MSAVDHMLKRTGPKRVVEKFIMFLVISGLSKILTRKIRSNTEKCELSQYENEEKLDQPTPPKKGNSDESKI